MSADESDSNIGSPESLPEQERARSSSRRKPLTPELRRFLGRAQSWHEREAAREQAAEPDETPTDEAPAPSEFKSTAPWPAPVEPAEEPPVRPDRPRTAAPTVLPDRKISRALEMQTVALVVGGLIILGAAFYAGTKLQRVKAFLASRNKPEVTNVDVKKFPGLTANELVEQALVAERLGNWHDAVERLLVAKRRDVLYRDVIFHAGKLCYEHGDFDSADRLLDRAVAFGEQVDTANYLRGLIAMGRNDLPAAEQLFQAAIEAEPFTPGYYYYLAEALRREHRPVEAVSRYEQAATRTVNEQDADLCRFKARMAKAETADRSILEKEVAEKRGAGPLSVDWLMTDAALKIRAGETGQAAELIQQARTTDEPRLATVFASCSADMLFTEAANNHPEIAAACRVGPRGISSPPAGSSPAPSPLQSPRSE